MSAFALILYIFLFGIGLLTICLSHFQYKKYHQHFYSSFLYYLIANVIFGFINYFGRFITKNILSEHDISIFTRNVIDLLLNGLALPFCVLGIIMILLLIADYIEYLHSTGGRISNFIRVSLAAVNTIFVLANYFAVSQIFFLPEKNYR